MMIKSFMFLETVNQENYASKCGHSEILMDCGNCMLVALNFSLIHFLKFKYYGIFTYITQIIHSDVHLTTLKAIFILCDKPIIIKEIEKFKFAEILDSKEMCARNVLNFSHV